MAKLTLLEIVQNVIEAIGANPVNDLNDTPTSRRITKFAKEVYEQERVYGQWPHLKFIGQLTGLGDTNQPTVMKIPDAVSDVDIVRYQYTDDNGNVRKPIITHIEDPQEFLELTLSRNSADSNVEVKNVPSEDTISIFVYNDREPKYWTTFDDDYIVMDAYDSSVEATLQGSKSVVTGLKETDWTVDKAFVPDLPSDMFPYYLSRVIVVSAERLTEEVAASDRQAEQRGRAYVRFEGGKTDVKYRKKKFGRR